MANLPTDTLTTPPVDPLTGTLVDTETDAPTDSPEHSVAQQRPWLAIRADSTTRHRPRLYVGGVLGDSALEEAVRSGLPIRLRFRVELWKDRFFDSLEDEESMTSVLHYDPLDDEFVLHNDKNPEDKKRFTSFAAARAAIEGRYALDIRPRGSGRFYYTALLQVETLSLSDLEELERWLKGELSPAVRGDGSVPGAVGKGVRRLMVRVLGLPSRRYEARSDKFRVDTR